VIRLAAAALLAVALAACAARPIRPAVAPAAIGPPAALQVFGRTAVAMVGRPYRYGGDQPSGFDCSGLVYFAARRAGVALPRTAEAQMRVGRRVSRRGLRAGDLVFMHFPRKELHVGISLGGGRFVHAPSSGERVRIDSLAAQTYARAYLEARRPPFAE
jgi:cell wall-associated NlpC family hydrolase